MSDLIALALANGLAYTVTPVAGVDLLEVEGAGIKLGAFADADGAFDFGVVTLAGGSEVLSFDQTRAALVEIARRTVTEVEVPLTF